MLEPVEASGGVPQQSAEPLVVTGESGCGKSALLAEWVARWREQHPDDLVIQHYIGSTVESADWQGIVRRILGELRRAFGIADEIPIQADALRTALNDWFVKTAGSRRIVLVLDALNQLSGDDAAARQLGWLPVVVPRNVCLFVSSLPGESLEALKKRGWPELAVPLFGRADIAPAATAYFAVFSKKLPEEILAQLESTSAACNALFLRAVLDELRQFGEHRRLAERTAWYLSAPAFQHSSTAFSPAGTKTSGATPSIPTSCAAASASSPAPASGCRNRSCWTCSATAASRCLAVRGHPCTSPPRTPWPCAPGCSTSATTTCARRCTTAGLRKRTLCGSSACNWPGISRR